MRRALALSLLLLTACGAAQARSTPAKTTPRSLSNDIAACAALARGEAGKWGTIDFAFGDIERFAREAGLELGMYNGLPKGPLKRAAKQALTEAALFLKAACQAHDLWPS